jgi:microcystin-dependent protein
MRYLVIAAAAWVGLCSSAPAQQREVIPFVGQIMIFAGNFCPRGWAATDGTVLPINQNAALFALLGNQYGGDRNTTFALPNNQPILTKNGAPLTQCIALYGTFPDRQ